MVEEIIPSCVPEKIHEMYQVCWRTFETANYHAGRLNTELVLLRSRINEAKLDSAKCSFNGINKLFETSKSWAKFAEECINMRHNISEHMIQYDLFIKIKYVYLHCSKKYKMICFNLSIQVYT